MLNKQLFIEKPCYAFFDVDETIISTKSMISFMDVYFSMYPQEMLQKAFNQEMALLFKKDTDWKIINRRYYSYFKHFPISHVKNACQRWFDLYRHQQKGFYHSNTLQRLQRHQREGTQCVFVSGSFRELLQPIADDIGVDFILSINLERLGLTYSGDILPPQTIGSGKADAITAFLEEQDVPADECYAYGDDISDVPMLQVVGKPVAVTGGRRLEEYAINQGWEIMSPT